MGAMGIAIAVEKEKVSTCQKGLTNSRVTATGSQVQSQASTWVQSGVQTGSRSNVQKSFSTSALPSKKSVPVTKADASPRSKKNKLLSKEELLTSLASVMSVLPEAPRIGEVIDYNNVNIIFQKFFTKCQDNFVFDDPLQKTELDVMRLVNMPDAWTIRAFEDWGLEDLKTYHINMLDKA